MGEGEPHSLAEPIPSLDKNGDDWDVMVADLRLGLVRNASAAGVILRVAVKECWNQLQKVKEQEEDNPSWAAEPRDWGVSGIPPPAASQVFLGLRNPLVLRTALGLRMHSAWVASESGCWTQIQASVGSRSRGG